VTELPIPHLNALGSIAPGDDMGLGKTRQAIVAMQVAAPTRRRFPYMSGTLLPLLLPACNLAPSARYRNPVNCLNLLVADAVAVEPFSAPNSLLTGKNTGKFIRIRLMQHGSLLESPDISATFDEIPCRSEQGNFGEETGKIIFRTA